MHEWNTALEDYSLYKRNRLNRKEGSVALCVKKADACTEMHKWEHRNPAESNWLRIKEEKNKRDIIVGLV